VYCLLQDQEKAIVKDSGELQATEQTKDKPEADDVVKGMY